jgi:hypothetical protein
VIVGCIDISAGVIFMGISIKHLEKCDQPSLVRMQIANAARFVFLGKHKTAFIPAVALMDGRWEIKNLSSSHGFMPEYEGASAVDFGSKFDIRINYSGDCALDNGPLFRSPGAIVCTEDAMILVTLGAQGWRDPVQYLDLKTGEHRGEPGGVRAAFAEWSLFLSSDDKQPLFKSVAQPPQ